MNHMPPDSDNAVRGGNQRWPLRLLGSLLWFALAAMPLAQAQDAASLRSRHAELRDSLAHNPFQRPIHLESTENASDLKGDIYAVIEQPFGVVGPALQGAVHWCEILFLHLNVKQCRAVSAAGGDRLALVAGSKHDQALVDAYRFEFAYQQATPTPDYVQMALTAEHGPMGTSHYRIGLEVVALDAGRSFLHLSYGYEYGTTARLAMQVYLATLGRKKVGFSVVGNQPNGQPKYIGGTRGVVERNTMRYYLAIDAFLGALSEPAPRQLDARLNAWFAGVERYPVQLHELERGEYMALKRGQLQP